MLGVVGQMVVLPMLFPLTSDHGLVLGGDTVYFQTLATDMYIAMKEKGWEAWNLRPEGQGISGITAALYYLVNSNNLIWALSIHCLFFGIAVGALHRIITGVTGESVAWVGVLPIIFFPSSFMIYGQLHKDVYSVAGTLLLICSLVDALTSGRNFRDQLYSIIQLSVGILLIWAVRPYLIDIALGAWWIGAFLILSGRFLKRDFPNRSGLACFGLILFIQVSTLSVLHSGAKSVPIDIPQVAAVPAPVVKNKNSYLDKLTRRIDNFRQVYIKSYPGAGSMIDEDVRFNSFLDLVAYSLRAVQIGLLAPFPDRWVASGGGWKGLKGAMHIATALEMLIAYLGMIGIIVYVLMKPAETSFPLWGVLLAALAIITIHVVVVPNLGSLYRIRLPAWHIWTGIGLTLFVRQLLLCRYKACKLN